MTSYAKSELKQGMEAGRKKLGIEDLPIETQKDIFKHVRYIDQLESPC